MKKIQLAFKAALLLVMIFTLNVTAQTVEVTAQLTGTADVSEIHEQLNQIDEGVKANAVAIEQLKAQLADDQQAGNNSGGNTSGGNTSGGSTTGVRFGCNVGYKDDTGWSPEGLYKNDPRYVEYLKPVAKCLRFEWWRSNDEVGTDNLTEERKAHIDRYIDLCNATGADIHLVFFIHDDEATIKWIVERVRSHIHADATRYYEVPNEMWNGGSYKDKDGVRHATGTSVFKEIARISGQPDFWTDGNTGFFKNTAEIASRQVGWFKQYDPGCVTVLGCLTANPWWMENVESYMTNKPDAHGLTFYFGTGWKDSDIPAAASVDQILAQAKANLPAEIKRIKKHAAKSLAMGRRIIGYEGGPHLVVPQYKHSECKVTWQNMNVANRDPRIVPLCDEAASAAEAAGFERLDWYLYMSLYDKWGSWGLGENIETITTNLKYRYAAGQN